MSSQVFTEIAEELQRVVTSANDGQPPPFLYHYTNSVGMMGVAQSGEVWLSDFRLMNDTTEIKDIFEIYESVQFDRKNDARYWEARPLFQRVGQEVEFRIKESPPFVACFSELRDSLGQWRAYGDGANGFGLGFKGFDLEKAASAGGAVLVQVIYDENKKKAIMDDFLLRTARAYVAVMREEKTEKQKLENILAELLIAFLAKNCAAFKNSGFSEEAEWRIVWRQPPDAVIEYRNGYFGLTPFKRMSVGGKVPFSYCILGPRINPDIHVDIVYKYLTRVAAEERCLVDASTISYRA